MASPRTWVTAELVTATIMNADVRDKFVAVGAAKAIIFGLGDVAGDVLTTGVKAFFEMPFAFRITGWTLLASLVGSIVLDIWKDSYANFPPTGADTIAGTEKPTLSAVQKNQDLSLSTWTTDLAAGDIVAVNVDSVTSIKQATLTLRGTFIY